MPLLAVLTHAQAYLFEYLLILYALAADPAAWTGIQNWKFE